MHRTVVVNALVYVHSSLHQINRRISRRQGRAERKKAESIGIQPALVEQDKPIHQQPAVAEAESAVKEATADDRQSEGSTGYHSSRHVHPISSFNIEKVTTRPMRDVEKHLLSRPSYNFKSVNRASKSRGPLVKRVLSKVKYSEILDRLTELNDSETRFSLPKGGGDDEEASEGHHRMIVELEAKIATHKEEYALLISETRAIESEMEWVESKFDRGVELLESLSSERGRWESVSRAFNAEIHHSLQSQFLDQVLKVERPDTDEKRTDLMKIQGEFRLRLRTLAKLLLQALNESQGNTLDDDKVIDTLETLKQEAAEVTRKVEETDIIMKEVGEVTAEYLTIAQACSAVFFVLEQLNVVNHFYQFSLRFFHDIFDYVLHHNPNLKTVTDYSQRRDILLNDLFLVVYKRTSRALLHRDRVMLAVLLGQVKLRGVEDIGDELEFLLESGDSVAMTTTPSSSHSLLTPDQALRLESYAKNSLFKPETHLIEHEDEWRAFL
ncbi:dynein heavy chain [Marasmius tenuissimus]|uniref:Dynein heavy chain n=1 Tax=Marasmius tenuissimus TaxID=585030 RepID=A0ABR2ZRJ1_9AGAR